MNNIPEIKLGIVAVSRDCFPVELSQSRRNRAVEACRTGNIDIVEIDTVVEKEEDLGKALKEIHAQSVNALIVFLGNFGPESPTTQLAQKFEGPVMFVAAAEESEKGLIHGRGDAFCGLLNTSYNAGLRNLNPYMPDYPVGTAGEIAGMIRDFIPVARIVYGLKKLKIFAFGPRPQDFFACNAPIKPLFDLGVEVMENSELDLYDIFLKSKDAPEIKAIMKDMTGELGTGNKYPDLLEKLAQYEVALMRFMDAHLGASEFGVFANKCWPAFEHYFGFVPCYVNSRLASRGIPVACEVDIYGAMSEYMAVCATKGAVTLLDINNTVPEDMYKKAKNKVGSYKHTDLFMGFHCGNTPAACLKAPQMKYQLIMNRLLEDGQKPDITRGTLEGQIKHGNITIFRLQSTADTQLNAYIAEGEVLDIPPQSFGSIGVFAIKEMSRFYRHVLIQKQFPHHTAVAFAHAGKALFAALRMLGVSDISYNHPSGLFYKSENPFG
ncbi:MAG: fucose isomerase [Candidatus Aminicenantes bacterium]|nr:fucose isomerase [Candidatus Aminicenantes bacterium]